MITPGQIYVSCNPRDNPPIRIRITGVIPYGSAQSGRGTAQVVTVTADGLELRPRSMKLGQLHDSATTRDGQPRRTGYVLVAEPAPVDGWLPNLTDLPLGELAGQLDSGLADAVDALLDGVEHSMTTTAGSSGS